MLMCLPALLRGADWRIRAGLALGLAIVLTPVTPSLRISIGTWTALASLAVGEFVIGAALSLAGALVLGGVRLAAELIDQQLGLTLSEGLALGGEGGVGVASTLFRSLAILAFLQLGGHLQIVAACAESLRVIPPGTAQLTPALATLLRDLVQQSFVLALRLAGPVWGATALAAFAWGLLGRAMPSLNGLSLGAPWRVCVGLLALSWGLPLVAEVVNTAVPTSVDQVLESAIPTGDRSDRPGATAR